jgi:hypothetical protein
MGKNTFFLAIGIVCILALAVMPAQAFTTKDLTITYAENGDANLNVHYDLSVPEMFAVFLKIADPAQELKKAFEQNLNKEVTVVRADSSSIEVIIPTLASEKTSNGTTTMKTPALSFARAQDAINQYWFAPLISPDLSPAVSTITFPDGHSVKYYDQISIPSVTYSFVA